MEKNTKMGMLGFSRKTTSRSIIAMFFLDMYIARTNYTTHIILGVSRKSYPARAVP